MGSRIKRIRCLNGRMFPPSSSLGSPWYRHTRQPNKMNQNAAKNAEDEAQGVKGKGQRGTAGSAFPFPFSPSPVDLFPIDHRSSISLINLCRLFVATNKRSKS